MITSREFKNTVNMYTGLYELPARFAWAVFPCVHHTRVFTRGESFHKIRKAKVALQATRKDKQ